MAARRVNQQLLADRLKLSRATVSRCFTNHPGISPATRARVFSLARRLGYAHLEQSKPRAHADRLARLPLGVLVCVDLPSFDNTFYGNPGQEILTGVTEYARTAGFTIDLHFLRPETLAARPEALQAIEGRRRRWRGVLLIYPFPPPVVARLLERYPVVSLVEQQGPEPVNCVDVDHFRGVARLVDELARRGHRRIGFFTWRYGVEASWALRRHSAFLERLLTLGLPYRAEDVLNVGPAGALPVDEAHAAVARRTRDGVTAWVCAADHQAYDLMAYLQSVGLEVPRDVSVTGFDGLRRPQGAPELTTIEIPYRQIGITGARRLGELVHKRFDPPQHILLDGRLRSGATLGGVPAARSFRA